MQPCPPLHAPNGYLKATRYGPPFGVPIGVLDIPPKGVIYPVISAILEYDAIIDPRIEGPYPG